MQGELATVMRRTAAPRSRSGAHDDDRRDWRNVMVARFSGGRNDSPRRVPNANRGAAVISSWWRGTGLDRDERGRPVSRSQFVRDNRSPCAIGRFAELSPAAFDPGEPPGQPAHRLYAPASAGGYGASPCRDSSASYPKTGLPELKGIPGDRETSPALPSIGRWRNRRPSSGS